MEDIPVGQVWNKLSYPLKYEFYVLAKQMTITTPHAL